VHHAEHDTYEFTFETPETNPDHIPSGNADAGAPKAMAFINTATGDVLAF
jgi:hypothetical protein